ncbi:MAG TPA: DEAD/DEAH box helicase [Burkholderiaceae bacterium]|nr:DEAD/DEAH box helicase [Burkholderiaceae bacterium]
MSFALRPYQDAILAEVREHLRAGRRSILIQAPTGSGKTALTAYMAGTAAERGRRVWFTVHRRELIRQSMLTFGEVGIAYGVIAAGFAPDPRRRVQICGIQTLGRRAERLKRPDIIIVDEAHHIAASSWAAILQQFSGAIVIGLSATPERLDGAGLSAHFEVMVCGPSTAQLIAEGWLAPYRLFAPRPPDLAGVHTKLGDFVRGEVSAVMDTPRLTGDAIQHYLRLARGKRALAFACSIEHSRHIVEQARAAGIRAAHVDGETHHVERDAAFQAFARGEIQFLSNVELAGEGVDIPGIEVAILLRPTQSLALYLQQVGRSLRPAAGKTEALILDHAGNALRHGLPDDERLWTLEGRRRRRLADAENQVPIKICPRCFLACASPAAACKHCGFVFPVEGRQVEEVAGELVEVDPDVVRAQRKREERRASTLEDLVALGRARGYRYPEQWAQYVYRGRKAARARYGAVRWGT